MMHKERTGGVVGFPDAEPISNEELLALECDVLIPAALENAIHGGNAGAVRAGIIAEAANGPVTPEADRILEPKAVFIIPDILCNGGGLTVSYFEWLQNEQHLMWELHEVHEQLERVMKNAFHEVLSLHLDAKRACAWRRTCWAWAGWPRPSPSVASTRDPGRGADRLPATGPCVMMRLWAGGGLSSGRQPPARGNHA